MKIVILISSFFLLLQTLIRGQTKEERKELINLVEERQELFDRYSSTLKKKSGFFGQKTKNDLRASHDNLKEIVALDNKIMTRLKQMLSYRNFEKQSMSYNVNQYAEQLKNYESSQDTLVKQLAELEKQNALLQKSAAKSSRIYYILLGFILAIILNFILRKFRKSGIE